MTDSGNAPRQRPEAPGSGTPDPETSQSSAPERAWVEAAPPRPHGREAWVGLFVVVAVLAILTALFTLTDASLFRGRYETQVRVDQAAGIRRGDPVRMKGVNIGTVKGFDIGADGVLVRLEIEGEYPVPADSRVELVSGGLLGGLAANVVPGSSPDRAGRQDVLPGRVAGGVVDAAEEVGSEATAALRQVRSLLDPRTVDAVGASAVELQALLGELNAVAAEERAALRDLTGSLRRSAEGLEGAAAGPELERIVRRLDALSAEAGETVASTGRAVRSLEVVLGRLERGEGTLGRLSTDPALYDDLQAAAAGVTALVEDIRRDPGRYIDLRVF